jgi:4'-phosphopantetheinyl transferase EntD
MSPRAWVRAPHRLSARVRARALATQGAPEDRRQRDFASGRLCAREALGDAGAHRTSVGIGPRGEPQWPDGFVGSITHSGALACAAVALSLDLRSVGIDSERIMSDAEAREVVPMVLRPSERRLVAESPRRRELETLAFSAKESLYKCLYPCVGVFFEFTDAELEWIRAGEAFPDETTSGTFGLRLQRPLGTVFPSGFRIEGRYSIEAGHVHTAVELLAR